ncbi:DNA-binding transcription factor yap1 [Sorochytrium milnesiophthora]
MFGAPSQDPSLTSQPSALTIVDLFPAELLPWNLSSSGSGADNAPLPNQRKHARKSHRSSTAPSASAGDGVITETEDDEAAARGLLSKQQRMSSASNVSSSTAFKRGSPDGSASVSGTAVDGHYDDDDAFAEPLKEKKKAGRKPSTAEPSNKRKAQNRAAQRAFRERKERYIKQLETRVQELEAQPGRLGARAASTSSEGSGATTLEEENARLRAMIHKLEAENYYLKGMSFTFDVAQPSVSSAVQDLYGNDPPDGSGLSVASSFSGTGTVPGTATSASIGGFGYPFGASMNGSVGYAASAKSEMGDGSAPSQLDLLMMEAVDQTIRQSQQNAAAALATPASFSWNMSMDNTSPLAMVKDEPLGQLTSPPLTQTVASGSIFSQFPLATTDSPAPTSPPVDLSLLNANAILGSLSSSAPLFQPQAMSANQLFTFGTTAAPSSLTTSAVVDFKTHRAASPTGSTDSRSTTNRRLPSGQMASAAVQPFSSQFTNPFFASTGLDMDDLARDGGLFPQSANFGGLSAVKTEPTAPMSPVRPGIPQTQCFIPDDVPTDQLTRSERHAKVFQFLESKADDTASARQWKVAISGFLGENLLNLDELCDLMAIKCTCEEKKRIIREKVAQRKAVRQK